MTPVTPGTGMGAECEFVVPSPSWPLPFAPHAHASVAANRHGVQETRGELRRAGEATQLDGGQSIDVAAVDLAIVVGAPGPDVPSGFRASV